MVRIRLRRIGAKKQPSYRIIAAHKEAPRDGAFLEILGHYNPRTEPATIDVQEDRIYHWLSVGAQPSDSVVQLFNTIGLIGRFDRFKAGEDIEALLAEAHASMAARNINPQTKRAGMIGKPKKKAKAEEATD